MRKSTPHQQHGCRWHDALRVLDGLKRAKMFEHTIVLITADHGGKGKKRGEATMGELEIPWIISGPGVAAGKEIKTPVNTYYTAVTVPYIFGLKTPSCWIGKPVLEAFQTGRSPRAATEPMK